jgi:hypothetical protein
VAVRWEVQGVTSEIGKSYSWNIAASDALTLSGEGVVRFMTVVLAISTRITGKTPRIVVCQLPRNNPGCTQSILAKKSIL